MSLISPEIAFIGFGEAGQTFAQAIARPATGFDILLDDALLAAGKRQEFIAAGVAIADSAADAAGDATLVLSLVTADQCLSAAIASSKGIAPGTLYCDMNSAAPRTKSRARAAIEQAGGRYADVAIMAPVSPAALAVPMLVSGAHTAAAVKALNQLGFSPRGIEGDVGAASAIKMVRSVLIKGMEAVAAEFILAADVAGVTVETLASIEASWPDFDWEQQCNISLERMMRHGKRRASEMDEVANMLEALGVGNVMTTAAATSQRSIGNLSLFPADSLSLKLDQLHMRRIGRA